MDSQADNSSSGPRKLEKAEGAGGATRGATATRRRADRGRPWTLSAIGQRALAAPLEAVAECRSEYENLLDGIYDAVLVTTQDGRIVETNSRAVDFFRYDGEALARLNVRQLLVGADEKLLPRIHRNLEHHRYTLIEGTCARADRKTFPAEIAVSRLMRRGEPHLTFFVRNITERKRAQDALKEAVARLEEHDRARAQFVSNVSHELKTPLTSMMYAVYNMLNGVVGPLPSRVRRYLQMLDGDCRRMLATVSDILDLRRLDTDTLRLDYHRVPLGRLVRWALMSLQLQARQKQLTLQVDGGVQNVFLDCDPPKIERVVLNVVGNAIKFTPAGGTVHVQVLPDKGAERVSLLVDDSGIGIPPEHLPRVTERYFTVGAQPAGTGLGLAISKEIVVAHGGELRVESPVPGRDRGTRVAVSLPVAEPPLIMVIEDDDLVRGTVAAQVESWGFRVSELGDGGTAVERVKRERPDLIILDLQLPGAGGTDVILKLKANLEMMRTPILVLTGLRLNEKQDRVLANFGIPTLSKPWQESELREHVEMAFLAPVTAIRRAGERKRARPQAAARKESL